MPASHLSPPEPGLEPLFFRRPHFASAYVLFFAFLASPHKGTPISIAPAAQASPHIPPGLSMFSLTLWSISCLEIVRASGICLAFTFFL
jgi:hypothetical protein